MGRIFGLTQENLKANFKEFDIEKGGQKNGIYTNTSENRKLGRVGQKYSKEPSSTEKRFMDLISISKSGMRIEDIKVHKTPKGNWAVEEKGKNLMTIGSNQLSEKEAKDLGILEEA